MRVLIWASSFGKITGGGPVLMPLLASSLAARGHHVTVFVDDRHCIAPSDETTGNMRVLRLPFQAALRGSRALLGEVLVRVAGTRAAFKADVEYIFSTSASSIFRDATQGRRQTPVAVGMHDFLPQERFMPTAATGRALRQADWVIGCSEAVIAAARLALPEIAGRSSAILNALPDWPEDIASVKPSKDKLLFLGRLVCKKGTHILLDAFSSLTSRFPGLQLQIGGEGDQLIHLQRRVRALGNDDRITFLGPVAREDVARVIAGSFITIVPSLEEPFGLVALEAALAGRPVVASRVGGLPEILKHGETGLLVPPSDPVALAAAVEALLRAPERAATLGQAARARAKQRFSWDDYVDAHEDLLHRLSARA